MKRIVFHPDASAELDEAIAYYEEQKKGLGLEFASVVEEAISQIRENPQFGAAYKTTPFRHFTIRRFPYIVFYTDREDALWVAAIAHGKRRPDYWKRRKMG